MADLMAWAATIAVTIGILARLPAAATRFIRALMPLVRACRDLWAELRGRGAHERKQDRPS
ncbi:hypothetical protein [Lentzea sp. NPDC003310]|uniref:hypothetical protein n=1 Tax=Lentzea sp. NPDC003310 TaxID=3154447 RepID=UPI0033A76524